MNETIVTVFDKKTGEKLDLTGVTGVRFESALLTQADENEKTPGAVHHAINEPDTLIVSLTVSAAALSGDMTAAGLCASLAAMKRNRRLLRVTAPMKAYTNMLLSGIMITETSECQDGWTGELTFQQAEADNKSVGPGTGGSGARGCVSASEAPDLGDLPLI